MKKEKSKNFIKVFLITFISALVVIAIVMGIVILGNNNQKQNNKQLDTDTTISKNEDLEQNAKENIKVNENIKYSADSIVGTELENMYIVFNDNNFMVNEQVNLENQKFIVYFVGNYTQNESNIIFNYINAKIEYNNIEMNEPEYKEIFKSSFNEIFGNGGTISNNGKTITFSKGGEQVEFNAKDEKVAFDIANSILKGNTSIDTENGYYDFIDPQYGTFNFTEEEYIERFLAILGGNGNGSYQMHGYTRTKATTPNQYNYAKMSTNGSNRTDVISIVSNPANGKVSSIQVSIVEKINTNGKSIEEKVSENLSYVAANMVGGIINYTDMSDIEKTEEGKVLMQEIVDKISPQKGLQVTMNAEQIGESYDFYGINCKMEVIKK